MFDMRLLKDIEIGDLFIYDDDLVLKIDNVNLHSDSHDDFPEYFNITKNKTMFIWPAPETKVQYYAKLKDQLPR